MRQIHAAANVSPRPATIIRTPSSNPHQCTTKNPKPHSASSSNPTTCQQPSFRASVRMPCVHTCQQPYIRTPVRNPHLYSCPQVASKLHAGQQSHPTHQRAPPIHTLERNLTRHTCQRPCYQPSSPHRPTVLMRRPRQQAFQQL